MRATGSLHPARREGPRPPRRHADLRVMPLLEVRLRHPHDGHPLSELLQKEGAEAHLIACRLTDRPPRRLIRWLDVEVDPGRMDRFLQALRRRVLYRNLAHARLGPGRVLLRINEAAPAICVTTYGAGGICVTCPLLTTRDRTPWEVILPRGIRAPAILRDLPFGGSAHPAITRFGPYRSRTTLTSRQDHALRIAYDLGYFAYPRRGSLQDVARALGSGRSATLEILRRATAKLAGRRYGDEMRVRVAP